MDYYINYPGISVPAYQSFLKLSINPWNAGTINRESKGSSTSLGVLNPLCHHPCIVACSAWGHIAVLIKVKKKLIQVIKCFLLLSIQLKENNEYCKFNMVAGL